jgi:hypothetical protein
LSLRVRPFSLVDVVPWVGWSIAVLMSPIQVFVAFYMLPVNSLNAWDRAAKRSGVAPRQQGELLPRGPSLSVLQVESPMAY